MDENEDKYTTLLENKMATTPSEKRVSFAVKLEEAHGPEQLENEDSLMLSPKNSNVMDEENCGVMPSSLSQIRKDVDFIENSSSPRKGDRGPWSMGCFMDGICVQPGERGAEVSVPSMSSQLPENKENVDAPGTKFRQMYSSSNDSDDSILDNESILDNGDTENTDNDNDTIDEDAFLPDSEDAFVPPDAFLPDSEEALFLPEDESAFLPPEMEPALLDAEFRSEDPSLLLEEQEVQLSNSKLCSRDANHPEQEEAHKEGVHLAASPSNEEEASDEIASARMVEERESGDVIATNETQEIVEVKATFIEEEGQTEEEETPTSPSSRNCANQDNDLEDLNASIEPMEEPEDHSGDGDDITVERVTVTETAAAETLVEDFDAIDIVADLSNAEASLQQENMTVTEELSEDTHDLVADLNNAIASAGPTMISGSQSMENTAIEIMRSMSQEEEIQELRILLKKSQEEQSQKVSQAVKEVETKLKEDNLKEVVKVVQSVKIAHSVQLHSRDRDNCQRERKLEEEKKEQVLKIAGAMKVASAIRNEFVEEEELGELRTLKHSLGNLLRNQRATIEMLQASVIAKDKEITDLKMRCTRTAGQEKCSQSSLRVAEKTIISMKGEDLLK